MRKQTISMLSFLTGVALTAAYFNIDGIQIEDSEVTADSARVTNTSDRASIESTARDRIQEARKPTLGDSRTADLSREVSSQSSQSQEGNTEPDSGSYQPADGEIIAESSALLDSLKADRDPVNATTNAQRQPVPIPDELQEILDGDPKASDFHGGLENENRDDSWATFMEGQLAGYLASKPELATFQILLIQCRTSKCEVQALGYGPDAAPIWFAAVADLPKQPWAVEFDDGTFQMAEPEPGVTAILMQFGRLKGDSNLNSIDTLVTRH